MGMQDRDWFREKRIDYQKGGLVQRIPISRKNNIIMWLLVVFVASLVGGIIALTYTVLK